MESSGWMGQACGQPPVVCILDCVEKRLHQAGLRWHLVCFEGDGWALKQAVGCRGWCWEREWAIHLADVAALQLLTPQSFKRLRCLNTRLGSFSSFGFLFLGFFFPSVGICRKQGHLPKHQFRKASGVSFQVLVPPWLYVTGCLISAGRSYTASTLLPCMVPTHS